MIVKYCIKRVDVMKKSNREVLKYPLHFYGVKIVFSKP
jgi:hypothetical protein